MKFHARLLLLVITPTAAIEMLLVKTSTAVMKNHFKERIHKIKTDPAPLHRRERGGQQTNNQF